MFLSRRSLRRILVSLFHTILEVAFRTLNFVARKQRDRVVRLGKTFPLLFCLVLVKGREQRGQGQKTERRESLGVSVRTERGVDEGERELQKTWP